MFNKQLCKKDADMIWWYIFLNTHRKGISKLDFSEHIWNYDSTNNFGTAGSKGPETSVHWFCFQAHKLPMHWPTCMVPQIPPAAVRHYKEVEK